MSDWAEREREREMNYNSTYWLFLSLLFLSFYLSLVSEKQVSFSPVKIINRMNKMKKVFSLTSFASSSSYSNVNHPVMNCVNMRRVSVTISLFIITYFRHIFHLLSFKLVLILFTFSFLISFYFLFTQFLL